MSNNNPKRKAGAASSSSAAAAGTAADYNGGDSSPSGRKSKKAKAQTVTDCNSPASDARCRLLFYRVFVSNDPEPDSKNSPSEFLLPIDRVVHRHRDVLADVRSSGGVLETMGELLCAKFIVQYVLEFLDGSPVEWKYFGGPLLGRLFGVKLSFQTGTNSVRLPTAAELHVRPVRSLSLDVNPFDATNHIHELFEHAYERVFTHDCLSRADVGLKIGDSDVDADDITAAVDASAGTNPCAKCELKRRMADAFKLGLAVYSSTRDAVGFLAVWSNFSATMTNPRMSKHPHFLFPFSPGPSAGQETKRQSDAPFPAIRLTPRRLRLLSIQNVPGVVRDEFRTGWSEAEDGDLLHAQYKNVSSVKKVAMELRNEIYRVAIQMEDYSIWFKLILFAKAFPDPYVFGDL
jgi:hypothetical protein